MKNWIGLLLLRSCVFIERGGTKCGGIHNKFGGGKKTADGLSPHYRTGLEVGCKADRFEPGKIPFRLFIPIVEKAFCVNQTDMENHIKKRLRKFL